MDEKRLTENNNIKVYNETTKPAKKKRRDKSDLGENFIAPDGGWAWAVCLAAGISNLSIFPCLQQYGLVYRERLHGLGFKNSQISTIVNVCMGVSALTGLVNGAMFRRFTFRQVAITGAIFITTGILATVYCVTFLQYIIFFSVIFGIGIGISMSSTSLAINTYFKLNRRRATGFSWTITGLGPILFPHLVTWTLQEYGVQGTVYIFAAISLNAIAAGLVLQPVLWHVKSPPKSEGEPLSTPDIEHECKYCSTRKRKRSIFSSQYIFNDDDADRPGFEITTPCTPMLSRANDGYYGSKLSLSTDLSIFPCLQQYGLVYRERLHGLGFKNSQISTIVNVCMGVSALTGLVNGAMFRRFTFRQVAITGAIFITTGILATVYCVTFLQYIIFFSVIFGIGIGISMSSTSLAINTYFKLNRRRATGFSWTITGLGPILFPHLVTWTLQEYGVQGTVYIFAAISLNAIAAGLVLQPVLWHVKSPPKSEGEPLSTPDIEHECKYCSTRKRKRSIFSSQYIFNDDDADRPGFEITTPCTPMLSRANDGYYGSKLSLSTDVNGPRKLRRQLSANTQGDPQSLPAETFSKPNYFNLEKEDQNRYASKTNIFSKRGKEEFICTCAEEKAMLKQQIKAEKEETPTVETPLTFGQKVVKFFDLDLLTDFTFVNLMVGLTVILFGEMNFSILTPFILHDFGFHDSQISYAMSVIGAMDVIVRFFAPFVLENVKLGNRFLLAIGIISLSVGRYFITITRTYEGLLAIAVLVGFGKGFRTIFSPLIISSYVPLNRLPAASGLQLISNGIFTFAIGPVIGMITDATSYVVSIHFINTLTFLSLFVWALEDIVRKFMSKKKQKQLEVVLKTTEA